MAKTAGLYKRGSIWWVSKDPVTGKRVSTGVRTAEGAKEWLVARERYASNPAFAASERSTLGEWFQRFIVSKKVSCADATVTYCIGKMGPLLRIFGQSCPLSQITPKSMDYYVMQRRMESVSELTIAKEVSILTQVLKQAKRVGAYAGDLDILRPDDLKAKYTPRKRALSRQEVMALLSELPPHRGAFVAVCVALGTRRGEAVRLLPSDVDLAKQRVLIRGTKTAGSYREVPILTPFLSLLEQALPYLPLQAWGSVARDLPQACKHAGIERCSPNDLRRTHATLLIEAGVSRDVVRRFLGHTTAAMVDRVYGQPSVEALRDLAEKKFSTENVVYKINTVGEKK